MPGAWLSRLPATFGTRILCATIHSTTCDSRVNPPSTRRHDRLSLRHALIVARAPGVSAVPNQGVASESRALAKVRSG
jgi:hypothetical protein